MIDRDDTRVFDEASRMLLGLAYRILGSRADAEDAVQDTFLKWQQADRRAIENPRAWLTTICTRRCIDMARAAYRTRVDYVGAWLPEPVHTASEDGADDALSLASSVKTAFLLMLERLTPKERAAYLLHDIFGVAYPEIAQAIDLQEAACRQLVSRARANVDRAKVRHATPVDRQRQLLAAFEAAVAGGSTGPLAALLSDDVELRADGGGKVPTIDRVLHGRADVLDFVERALRLYWRDYRWIASHLNGGRGVVLRDDGAVAAAVSFAYDESGRACAIYVVRNPDKLVGLDRAAIC